MPNARWLALLLLAALVGGSLAATSAYACYLRSAGYRATCAAYLAGALALPAEIRRVVPRSLQTRQFDGVRVFLPDRRGVALDCDAALLIRQPTPSDPFAYELELSGGKCEISARTWLRGDYRQIVESGLRPGFAPDGPRRVTFGGMELAFARDAFRAVLSDASGAVTFDSPTVGHAAVFCHQFNGHRSREPVSLMATFSPRADGVRIDRLELAVPRLPLAIVGLADLLRSDLRTGEFAGRLDYAESGPVAVLTARGIVTGLQLGEALAPWFPRPVRGRCGEIELEELRIEDRTPVRLRFRGVVSDLVLGDLLAPFGLENLAGQTTLRVREARLSALGIERLIVSGRCARASLADFSRRMGLGAMSGDLVLDLEDLTIEDNRIVSLDAVAHVAPPDDGLDFIEGTLLRELVRRALGVTLPDVLPERIEYTQLGVRLQVRDERLFVFGTHGDREKTILTVRLLGREVGLLHEPAQPFDLRPSLDELRRRAAEFVESRYAEFRARRELRAPSSPTSQP
ncbi:MAG: hypothetical protein AB7Q17_03160 [Phycisphaerae bacterium]